MFLISWPRNLADQVKFAWEVRDKVVSWTFWDAMELLVSDPSPTQGQTFEMAWVILLNQLTQLTFLLSNAENCEWLKNFRKVNCVVTNHNEVQDVSKPQNHKLTVIVVCGLGFSLLTGFLFATQKHSMNIYCVHGFVSFTVKGDL